MTVFYTNDKCIQNWHKRGVFSKAGGFLIIKISNMLVIL